MKNILFGLFSCLMMIFMVSCTKNSGSVVPQTATPSVVGNWIVVTDYTYNYQVGDSSATSNSNIYTGTGNDYYKFTADSNVYIKEGSFLIDTGRFRAGANKLISMTYRYSYRDGYVFTGSANNYSIYKCTADSLILGNRGIAPSGYFFGETLKLKKQ